MEGTSGLGRGRKRRRGIFGPPEWVAGPTSPSPAPGSLRGVPSPEALNPHRRLGEYGPGWAHGNRDKGFGDGHPEWKVSVLKCENAAKVLAPLPPKGGALPLLTAVVSHFPDQLLARGGAKFSIST